MANFYTRLVNGLRWQEFMEPFSDGTKWFEGLSMADSSLGINQSQEENPRNRPSYSHEDSKPEATQNTAKSTSLKEMQQLRIDFVEAMGIKSQRMNPSPIGGYKLEMNDAKRAEHLQTAQRIRERYADLVGQTGMGRDVLQKMDSNLKNRDRGTVWKC